MMEIALTKNRLDEVEAFILAFGVKAKGAVGRAATRTVRGVRTDGTRLIRSEYNVKAGAVRRAFTIQRATRNNLEAVARVRGHRLSLIHFSPRPGKPGMRKPPVGVSVRVKRQRKAIPGSFVARMQKNSAAAVFTRKGKARFPVKKLYSLAVPEMLDREDFQEEIQDGANSRFEKNLTHEVNRMLAKEGAR